MKIQLAITLIWLLFLSCNNADKTNQRKVAHPTVDSGVVKKSNPERTLTKADTVIVGEQDLIAEDQLNKAEVAMKDSLIWLSANMKLDHRIFGYEKPDTNSKKMILLSIFTSDVSGNPYRCPYGSFYETNEMNGLKLKFVSDGDKFVEVNVKKEDAILGRVFIDKKWIEFKEF